MSLRRERERERDRDSERERDSERFGDLESPRLSERRGERSRSRLRSRSRSRLRPFFATGERERLFSRESRVRDRRERERPGKNYQENVIIRICERDESSDD